MKGKGLAAVLLAGAMVFAPCAAALESESPEGEIVSSLPESQITGDALLSSQEEVSEITTEGEEGEETTQDTLGDDAPADNICNAVSDLLETTDHNAYINGYKNGTFNPEGNISRSEAAQIFYNLLKVLPVITAEFTDVPETAWYAQPVLTLASLGAIKGYSDGTFLPNANITRAEFVTIATRFAAMESAPVSFTDVREESWAWKYISSACGKGWVSGYPNGTFRPGGNITRAEAVQVVNRMLGRTPDPYVANVYYTVEFYDVARSHWAYPQICEAATTHNYTTDGTTETWALPNRYDGTGWTLSNGLRTYQHPETGELLSGFQPIGEYTYYFDPDTHEVMTGWQEIGGLHYLLPDMDQTQEIEIGERLTQVNFTPGNRSFGDISYLVVHYTAVPNDTPQSECNYFETVYRGSSAGYFVGESSILRCVADRDISWHCGNDVYYHEACRNYNSIGIEMCSRKVNAANASSPYDPDWYFDQGTVNNTIALLRELMLTYAVPIERIVRHNDISHKTCPAPYVNDFSAWQGFLQQVCDGQVAYDGSYQAEVIAQELNVRTGPGTSYSIATVLEQGAVVTVFEETGNDGTSNGRWVRTDVGWISYPYISRLG